MSDAHDIVDRSFGRDGDILLVGGVRIDRIVGQVGTPLFVYDRGTMVAAVGRLRRALPDRFDVWFTRIKESGGKVQAQPLAKEGDMATRGILGMLIDVVFTAYDAAQKELRYKPADSYNAILQYDKDTGKVAKVVFYHR